MSAPPVVGPLDPGHDRDPEFFAGGPDATVEDVLLQQAEEGLHGRVVAGSSDPPYRSGHPVAVERPDELPGAELRSAIAVQNAPVDVSTPGHGVVQGGRGQAGLHRVDARLGLADGDYEALDSWLRQPSGSHEFRRHGEPGA